MSVRGSILSERRFRLQTRFLVYFTVLTAAIMALVFLLVDEGIGNLLLAQAERRALALGRHLASLAAPSVDAGDRTAVAQIAAAARQRDPAILGVELLPESPGPETLRRMAGPDGAGNRLEVTVPLPPKGRRPRPGAVRLRVSTEELDAQLLHIREALLGVALLAIGLGALGSFFLARRIIRPLSVLAAGTRRAAAGDLESRLQLRTGDEMEELSRAFDDMIGQIRTNQRAVEELNRDLEEKVRGRMEDLEWTNAALLKAYEDRQQAETHMILSEKMASLGQFVAGIAHEINTPSSAINAAIFNVTESLQTLARQVPLLAAEGPPASVRAPFHAIVEKALSVDFARKRSSTVDIRQRTRDLEAELLRRGLPSPRELALAYCRLGLHEDLRRLVDSAPDPFPPPALAFLENAGNLAIAVSDIRVSIEAITRMVKALRNYSHLDRAEKAEADIHDGLETTLTILRSQIRYGIVVERHYSRLPPVVCNTNELNQVWTNVIHNAIQAMKGVGRLTIETAAAEGEVSVRITDTGPGIPADIRNRIFDPFFTTKDQGEGTGLGLGIAQQIVQRHQGRISVDSEPGRTCFEIRLPLTPVPTPVPEVER
jgi:signal transduction histidine kinase